MLQKLKILLWFLKRPELYPHLIHVVLKKLSPASAARDDSRQEALDWCAGLAVDTNTALKQLTGKTEPTPVKSLFSTYFENAERILRECPTKMGGPGDVDLLYWCAEHLRATRVIETGVAYGFSSLAILLSLQKRKEAKLISTDMPYYLLNNEKYVGCVVPEAIRSNWCLLRAADRQTLPKALKILEIIDLCHYDSDKSYDGRMWAYKILWEALRTGGFFISDDIGDNTAFKEFSKIVENKPIIIKKIKNYAGVIVKS